jgi:hypothetical protein
MNGYSTKAGVMIIEEMLNCQSKILNAIGTQLPKSAFSKTVYLFKIFSK